MENEYNEHEYILEMATKILPKQDQHLKICISETAGDRAIRTKIGDNKVIIIM